MEKVNFKKNNQFFTLQLTDNLETNEWAGTETAISKDEINSKFICPTRYIVVSEADELEDGRMSNTVRHYSLLDTMTGEYYHLYSGRDLPESVKDQHEICKFYQKDSLWFGTLVAGQDISAEALLTIDRVSKEEIQQIEKFAVELKNTMFHKRDFQKFFSHVRDKSCTYEDYLFMLLRGIKKTKNNSLSRSDRKMSFYEWAKNEIKILEQTGYRRRFENIMEALWSYMVFYGVKD